MFTSVPLQTSPTTTGIIINSHDHNVTSPTAHRQLTGILSKFTFTSALGVVMGAEHDSTITPPLLNFINVYTSQWLLYTTQAIH